MASPVRFPSGVNAFPSSHPLRDFPCVPNIRQIAKIEDFIPFRSGDFTATTGGTGAAAAAFPWNGGAVKLTSGSTSSFTSALALGAASFMPVPGNSISMNLGLAIPQASSSNPSTDAQIVWGLFDNVSPAAATNGIYFSKASGGSMLSLVILKNGTATTFNNIGDIQYPTGRYADPVSVNGSLSFNLTGTTYSSVAIASAGVGYARAPLTLATGTAGSGAQLYVQLGLGSGNSGDSAQARLSKSGLYAPYITAAGSGYTAGTLTADIIPWIDYQLSYNGKGRLLVGINGDTVLWFDPNASQSVAAGNTVTVTSSNNNFQSATQLGAGVAPVQPMLGSVYNLLPQVPLIPAFGIIGTTANNRVFYASNLLLATEIN